MTDTEILFTCLRCQEHYHVEHLEQPVTECPVCFYKPTPKPQTPDKRTND